MSSGDPADHHYIPRFYLKRWADDSGNIVEYQRFHNVKEKTRHYKAVGKHRELYTITRYPVDKRQIIEKKYFQEVDQTASDALDFMYKCGRSDRWKARTRFGWARFVLLLLLRTPRDVQLLRETIPKRLTEAMLRDEELYRSVRSDDDPETAADFMRTQETYLEAASLEMLVRLGQNKELIEEIANLRWYCVNTDLAKHKLLTSDQPLSIFRLNTEEGYIILPMGPSRLFLACKNPELAERCEANVRSITKDVNRDIVRRALKFVVAADDSQRSFVEKHFNPAGRSVFLEGVLSR